MASGSQTWSGNCADLTAPQKMRMRRREPFRFPSRLPPLIASGICVNPKVEGEPEDQDVDEHPDADPVDDNAFFPASEVDFFSYQWPTEGTRPGFSRRREEEVVRDDDEEHREREQAQEGEVAPVADAGHVADREEVTSALTMQTTTSMMAATLSRPSPRAREARRRTRPGKRPVDRAVPTPTMLKKITSEMQSGKMIAAEPVLLPGSLLWKR
jgi:hypothetical protein